MRGQIIDALFDQMEDNKDLFFLTADMGINLVERFAEKYPDRFANVGIAEQNLIGVASGLCNAGFMPFAYTISNFLIHRCFEQIRNDVSLHKYPVVMLGTSAGFDNAPLGPTHHIVDDWGVLRNLGGIDIYAPATADYARSLVERLIANKRPAYVRISKGANELPADPTDVVHIPGINAKTILVSYGGVAGQAIAAQKERSDISLLVFNRILPMDEDYVAGVLDDYDKAVIVEDHIAQTGLHSLLGSLAHKYKVNIELESRAPEIGFTLNVGRTPEYFYRLFGMDFKSLLTGI